MTHKVWDQLTVFTLLWSHVGILQCVKGFLASASQFPHISNIPIFLLSVALSLIILFVHFSPNNAIAMFLLCLTHLVSMVVCGAQSNHVVIASIIALSTLLSCSFKRSQWRRKLSWTMFWLLVVVYAVTAVHKLNVDWFNVKHNCASLYLSATFAMMSNIPELGSSTHEALVALVSSAPYMGILVEFALPTLLLLMSTFSSTNARLLCFRIVICLAALFHVSLSVPLPPMSVYPFSMLMVPMYAAILPDYAVGHLEDIAHHKTFMAIVVAIAACVLEVGIKAILGDESMPLEYPPYGLWKASVLWNILIWTAILCAVLTNTTKNNNIWDNKDTATLIGTTTSNKESNSISRQEGTNGSQSTAQPPPMQFHLSGMIIVIIFAGIGLCPYLGVRNHPALAMFSNLRTEGSKPNHLFLASLSKRFVDKFGYQNTVVTIHETNFHPLRHYQVNLGLYFSHHVSRFNNALGVSNEFWISPPAWKPPNITTNLHQSVFMYPTSKSVADDFSHFVPYSIPLIEMRRRLGQSLKIDTKIDTSLTNPTSVEVGNNPFYVKFSINDESTMYILNARDGALYSHSDICNGKTGKELLTVVIPTHNADDTTSTELPVEDSTSNNDEFLNKLQCQLLTPLATWESHLVRFRSFDSNYSPCRH